MNLKIKHGFFGLVIAGGFAASSSAWAHKGGDHEFQMMDTDNDGKVTAAEHAAGAKKMFEMMDSDKDGKVTAAEMEAHHEQIAGKKAKKMEMSAAEKIKTIDTNGDGQITAEEHAAGAKKMFEMMDTDNDGALSKGECKSGHAKLMHKGGSK